MMEAKSIFLESLQKSDVSMLPRLTGTPRFIKCRTCQFYQKCFQEDTQSTDAVNFGSKVSVLDQLVADVSAEVQGPQAFIDKFHANYTCRIAVTIIHFNSQILVIVPLNSHYNKPSCFSWNSFSQIRYTFLMSQFPLPTNSK